MSTALEAKELFARLGKNESEWRALVIAARASQVLGDKNRAGEYALRASDLLARLPEQMGSDYESYLSRLDIQRLRNQLSELKGST
ncbi:MAG: hypothetical protein ACR2LM_05900 [Pyrinomonadaceae bacterium]